jgi:hypothetical protein
MRFLRQVIVQNETINVSSVRTDDLPVNPLSMILVTIRCTNSIAVLSNFSTIAAILSLVTKIEVLYKGSAIMSGSAADLIRLGAFMLKNAPVQLAANIVDANSRGITIPILLGRRPFWADECFPAVRRGDLQLQITTGALPTGIATPTLQVETIELLEATPTRFMKATTVSKTPSATGDHDVDLPIGNKIAAVLLFGTTVPSGASFNASFSQLRLLLDNVEAYYARTNWETLHNELQRRLSEGVQSASHLHEENAAAAYAQFALTFNQPGVVGFFDQYAFLDFDPWTDGEWFLETAGRARVHLRINAAVADAIRLMPVEILDVSTGQGG